MVYIPPEDVLKIGGKIANNRGLSSLEESQLNEQKARAKALYEALQQAEAQKNPLEDSGSLLDQAKNVGAGVLEGLDLGRSALVATGHQTGLLARNIFRGEDNTVGPEQWLNETKSHIGAGDVIEQAFPDAPYALKVAGGGALDIAADPLNAVTFGPSKAAKEALTAVGMVDKEAARIAAREGVDAANRKLAENFSKNIEKEMVDRATLAPGEFGLPGVADRVSRPGEVLGRHAEDRLIATPDELIPPHTGNFGRVQEMFPNVATEAPTIQSIIADKAGNLSKKYTADQIAERGVQAIEKTGKGGFGFAGRSTGIGQPSFEKVASAIRKSDVGRYMGELFSPTARVTAEVDEHAARAVDIARSTGGNKLRQASREARDAIAAGIADAPENITKFAQGEANQAMVDDLRDLAPRLISDTPEPGMVPFGDTGAYMHPAVADTLKTIADPAYKGKFEKALKAYDVGINWLKRTTTLGPMNAVPHVGRNIFSNHLFAALYGGVDSLRYWDEARKIRQGLVSLIGEDADITAENLVKKGLTKQEAERGLAIHAQGLAGRGAEAFDDTGSTKVLWGTKKATKVNEWHEELSRGAVFLKALDDGLDPRMAAKRVRDAMLDYSNEGLTPFERKTVQRIVFFYKFPRRAIPAGIKFMAHSPGAAKAISQAGLGISFNRRNKYGQPIGLYMDTPLEAVAQEAGDLFTSNPHDFLIGKTNPVIKGLLDSKSRDWQDLLPMLGQGERAQDKGTEGFLTNQAVGAVGARIGPDYETNQAKADFEKALQDRANRGEGPSKTDKLRLLALQTSVPPEQAYTMTANELVAALIAKGASPKSVGIILAGQ